MSEDDLFTCIQFINMIKECRHDKIKRKHVDKFECLVRKHSGYHHKHQEHLEGCPPNSSLTTTTNFFNKPAIPSQPQGQQQQQQSTLPHQQQQLLHLQHLQLLAHPTT